MSPGLSILRPERAAHATIRGYLYQACLGVKRWMELDPEEVLLCEGDEDLDRRILGGGGVSEQVKVSSDGLGLSDRVVRESLRNFLVSYVALREQGETRRFHFTTTAPARRARGFDFLAAWEALQAFAEHLGQQAPADPVLPDLSGQEFERALYLHMAALAALSGERIEAAQDALERTLSTSAASGALGSLIFGSMVHGQAY